MREEIIAKRYAMGLYKAIDSKEFEDIKSELNGFLEILNSNKELKEFLLNPFYTKRQKKSVVEAILNELKFSDKTSNLILLLIEKGRLHYLSFIIGEFVKVWEEENNVYPVTIYTPLKLDSETKKEILKSLEKKFGGKVSPEFLTDKKLIGGILIKYKSTYYDGSVSGALNKLKEKIIKEN